MTPEQAVELIWMEQLAREQRLLEEAPPGVLTAKVRHQTETVLLTLSRFVRLTGVAVKLPAEVVRGSVDD